MKTAKTNYPKKCWYVAATSEEIGEAPLERRLLGEDVVLWRGTGGRITAFVNRCAHRAFPLSHSRVDGDRLVCGYHGCTYDTEGKCVHIPSQPQVPTGMKVRVFPLLEQPPFVWIWLGQNAAAAGSEPPRTPWINDPAWSTFASSWRVSANYMMVHEHYLDFSYAPILHRRDIPAEIRSMPAFSDVEVTETTVSYTRLLPEASLTDWQADATGLDSAGIYKHRESGTFVSPAMHRQYWEIATANGDLYTTTRTHAITPEDETSTHVFMQGSRDYRTDRDEVTARLRSFLSGVAERDTAVLEMASDHSGYDRWRGGVEFLADAAALRARRIVGVMLAKEAGRAAIRPGLAPTTRSDALSPRQPSTARS
ncbi:aromatic ring-hydroxylating dioxygenase subunit alpha [Mycobacterium sp. TY814]|uniref:aromatic ring-hydroxylating dioxygenase subunit alpha n=1 Tax=unclassified Mycobacterium TaxID=2642494 RepID=UPI002741171A|nr:aromatic ring-hydroxylating dioxygenase subunit alpha [Mycobacterium sp. TY814]MDP7723584.1 aromatic ring-hydroxylating dioxygenase subunit alpha [Mycobacterium sp. TY814]